MADTRHAVIYRILMEKFFRNWPLRKRTRSCNNNMTGLRVLQNSVHRTGGIQKWRRIVRNCVLSAGLGPAVSGS
jgi:hypothetical protein